MGIALHTVLIESSFQGLLSYLRDTYKRISSMCMAQQFQIVSTILDATQTLFIGIFSIRGHPNIVLRYSL